MSHYLHKIKKITRRIRRAKNESMAYRSVFISQEATLDQPVQIMSGSRLDGSCKIGRYTYIGFDTYITKSFIGRYVSIGPRVSIGLGEHDLTRASTSSHFYGGTFDYLTRKECNIGSDAWLGVDSVILRGVTVGIGAVVGANSVVTKNVPDFAVVVGSPAKIIKYRFTKIQIDLLLNSRWWELELENAKQLIPKLEEMLKSI
jgi:virginiamycin A acetyltransferase